MEGQGRFVRGWNSTAPDAGASRVPEAAYLAIQPPRRGFAWTLGRLMG
jgi:hypothetical protein